MATRDDERARLVPMVARSLRSQDFRVAFGHTLGRTDRHFVIVALPDDAIGYVFDRLAEAEGVGILAMPLADDQLELALLSPATPARLQVATEDDSIAEIHEDSEVGMLFDYLREVRSAVVCRVAARIIEGREPQPT